MILKSYVAETGQCGFTCSWWYAVTAEFRNGRDIVNLAVGGECSTPDGAIRAAKRTHKRYWPIACGMASVVLEGEDQGVVNHDA